MFAFLTGAAPWWWIIAGLALGAVEMLTFSYILIWPGLAAVAVGLWLFAQPGLSGGGQVALFALLSLAFAVAGRAWVMRRKPPPPEAAGLNRRAARLVGRRARVAEALGGDLCEVEIEGERWRARGAGPLTPGDERGVRGADGMTLLLED
ncbi:MAG: hypothetical protein COW75_05210 [Rhodobacterales bacterium CG18_big_fil_WC_8_21_14_2_50_71_9]|nr:MAG: hypothetical protein COW75_05210 [Rhodobacterales bacterium CG18_big_fil_WC_8_21_14_2_50_71_9]